VGQLRKCFNLCDGSEVAVTPCLVASAANPAGSISRFPRDAEWPLSKRGVGLVDAIYGPHTNDLFVSDANAQLPKLYAMLGGRQGCWGECPPQVLEGENAYAASPGSLLGLD
jgi:hypothetical protein